MPVQTAIAFATFFLKNDYMFTFHEGSFYLANYFCTFNSGCTHFHSTIGIDEENFVKFYRIAFFFFFSEVMNKQFLARFGLELLSLNVYNCVHLIHCITSYTVRRPHPEKVQRLVEPFGNRLQNYYFPSKLATFSREI